MTAKEIDILRLLVRRRGEVLTRDRMLNEVWGYDAYPNTRTVDSHIVKLRQKLEEDPANPKYILSIYGEGYKFVG
jgi:DNA-binding response OmpR family regulator